MLAMECSNPETMNVKMGIQIPISLPKISSADKAKVVAESIRRAENKKQYLHKPTYCMRYRAINWLQN
jgi:hypothetical protein